MVLTPLEAKRRGCAVSERPCVAGLVRRQPPEAWAREATQAEAPGRQRAQEAAGEASQGLSPSKELTMAHTCLVSCR